ncbi:trypsin-like peptidase domain-containing protein [Nonomuraea sp. NPDC049419]|uniref:VMAP-C domain-containing protein n=1 Tax=Nonomuraea sp. NPDC049419 TaxID=3155772 RepID=UPI00342CF12E
MSQTLGAGLLVAADLVLTCAHVVRQKSDLQVAFPQAQRQDLLEVPATVHMIGPWSAPGQPGDIAVLKLGSKVDLPPAQLLLRQPSRAEKYVAHGFPKPHLHVGAPLELALISTDTAGEWQHLRAITPYAEVPQQGFSGAAVYCDTTGGVVGIITDYSPNPQQLTGRMLPIQTIRRHWEELDDLLDLGWLPQKERRALRQIVTGATSNADLRHLMCQLFPGVGGHRDFHTVWDAIRYVGEELHGEERLSRFLPAVARTLTPEATQRDLRRWICNHLGADIGSTKLETAIVVRLDPLREGHDLEVSVLINDQPNLQSWRTTIPSAADIRTHVETGLTTMKRQVAGTTPTIEFVLPQSLLNEPVEEWEYGRDTPVVTQRAVLRYVDRLIDLDEWDPWAARTKSLRSRIPEAPQLLACNGEDPTRFYMRLKKESEACVLVCPARPDDKSLGKALHAGLPVIIWSRDPCPEDVHENCPASHLASRVAVTAPVDLPELIRRTRLDAFDRPPEEPHPGRNLALLWDDPERMPDPPAYMPEDL